MLRVLLGLAGLAAVVPLLGRSRRLIALAKSLPAPEVAARTAHRRTGKLFWINPAVEIALMEVALVLLARPALHVYWVLTISLVVNRARRRAFATLWPLSSKEFSSHGGSRRVSRDGPLPLYRPCEVNRLTNGRF